MTEEIGGFQTESRTTNIEGVSLPSGDWFERKYPIPIQPKFGDSVNQVILAPIRAEFHNKNLLHFLRELNQQRASKHDSKLGVLLLINDNVIDDKRQSLAENGIMDLPTAVPENRLSAQFLGYLVTNDLKSIEALDIDQDYKDVAKELLDTDKGHVDIRFDYITSKKGPHMGRFRLHLLNLLDSYKATEADPNNVICHFMDVDIGLSPVHFARLRKYYTDTKHEVNISGWDFIPDNEMKSKDLLLTSDQFRVYKGLDQLHSVLQGKYNSGSPTISGRLSALKDRGVFDILSSTSTGEDFQLSNYFRKKYGENLGNESEVYFVDRSRGSLESHFDAETRFHFKVKGGMENIAIEYDMNNSHIKLVALNSDHDERKANGNILRFNLDKQLSEYLDFLEKEIQKKYPNLKIHDELQATINEEKEIENAKVRLRRQRLKLVLSAVKNGRDPKEFVPEYEYRIIKPYINAFPEKLKQTQKEKSLSTDKLVDQFVVTYPLLFDSENPIHQQTAHIRGLVKYCAQSNISLVKDNASE